MSAITTSRPRLVPSMIASMLTVAVLAASPARLTGFAAPPAPPPVRAQAALTFTDTVAGGVTVTDAATGTLLATIPARSDGFLRMTLRLLAAARQREHIGRAQPFILTSRDGGRMQLADPATGLTIELEAFGPSNIAEFVGFLPKVSGS